MRLIDADELLKASRIGKILYFDDTTTDGYTDVLLAVEVERAPTIEAESVRHGHIVKKKRVIGRIEHRKCPECSHTWRKDKRCKIDEWLCSECGKVLAHNYANYCPNCGTKIDGDGKGE